MPLLYDTCYIFSLLTCVTFVIIKEIGKYCRKLGNYKNLKDVYIFFCIVVYSRYTTNLLKKLYFEVIVDSPINF